MFPYFCTHLIGLICVYSLPVTGNRQSEIITNKPERISKGEESVNKSLHQNENGYVCFMLRHKNNSTLAKEKEKRKKGGQKAITFISRILRTRDA